MICSRLDHELQKFAAKHRLHYTRYADDLTFSTHQTRLPTALAFYDSTEQGSLHIGDDLRSIIEENGFKINSKKIRLAGRDRKQIVTGLVVNCFVNVDRKYIRNTRAIIHAWRKFGLEALQQQFVSKYSSKPKRADSTPPSIVQATYGRIQYIGAVRGWDDDVYKQLRGQFNELSPRKIRVPSHEWLTTLQQACWVIEDDDDVIQGTAFFLKAYGLITNSHCVGRKPHIYHPSSPSCKYTVSVKAIDGIVDLAILIPDVDVINVRELPPQQFSSEVQYGDPVTLVGYPEYALGKEISIKNGEVHGFTTRSGIKRFNISATIIAGNSGGPVLNRAKRVVGVAVTGPSSSLGVDSDLRVRLENRGWGLAVVGAA